MSKHFCGGQVIYNRDEGFFWCQCCGCKFDSIETLEKENLIAKESDEQYEYEGMEVKQ